MLDKIIYICYYINKGEGEERRLQWIGKVLQLLS